MKKLTTLIITLFLTIGLNAQSELNNYLKIGAENNPDLKSKFSEYNAALERIPQVGTLADPQLTFGYFVSPIETRVGPQQAKLGVSQMFPWFGSLKAREDVYVQRAKSKYEVFEEAKSKLFFDLKSLYYDAYFLQKAIVITQENILILKTFEELSVVKIETGRASVVDEMRVEMEINELQNKLAYLKDNKWALEVEFNRLLNDSIHYQISLPEQLWDDSLTSSKTELLDTITSSNHIIKQIEHKILSWESEERASIKRGAPQISLGLDYSFIGKSNNPTSGSTNGQDAIMPKIGISIPLYRKKYHAMVQEAVFEMEASQYQKESQSNELVMLFEKSYRDYKDADRRILLYKRQSYLASKSLELLLNSYSTDGKNFEEVLRMERKALTYALELDKARADKNAEVAFINYLIGN